MDISVAVQCASSALDGYINCSTMQLGDISVARSEGGAAIAPCKGSDTSPTPRRMKMRMVMVMMWQLVVIVVKRLIIRIIIPAMTMV